jgi:hypothetical protein
MPFKPDRTHPLPTTADVHAAVAAVCPIVGVSIGRWEDRSTWRLHFDPEATPEQREMGKEALFGFKMQDRHAEDMGAPVVIR